MMSNDLFSEAINLMRIWEPLLDAFNEGQTDDQSIIDNFKIQSRILGYEADQIGGFGMMQELMNVIPQKMQRLVELSWHGIGDWRS